MTPAWHPHPDVWLLVGVLGLGYWWAIRRIGPAMVHPIERVVSRGQVVLYVSGLVSLYVAAGWPVHDLGERYLFSAHMVEHMVFMYVAPPLLLAGTPAWLMRWLLRPDAVLRVARVLTRPAVAFIAFNAVVALIHVPGVVALMVHSEAAHLGLHVLVLVTALMMWSPVLNPLIELPHLSYPGRMLYLFGQSIVPTVPASFLTFADGALYDVYAQVPRIWGMSVVVDQQIAGLLMKIGGGAILWTMIAVYFFKWFAVEDREGLDVLEWQKVERDLDRAELTKS